MSDLFYKYQSLKQAAELATNEVESCETLLESILDQVVLETIKKYQQKLSVGVQDSVTDLLDSFKLKVTQTIFDVSDSWQQANQGQQPILYPRGCRFCYSQGNNTVVVIEQEPQVRSLLFDGGMAGEHYVLGENEQRLRLSLPYSVFILHFRNSAFLNLYCGWRTRPLTGLNDTLTRPVLPNIHDNLNVCMRGHAIGSIVEQTDQLLTRFWNSRFNNDLSTMWWGKGRIDRRLETATWQDLTESDPMFILDVRLPEDRSLQRTLDLITAAMETVDYSAFRHRLSDQINTCVEDMFSSISRYFHRTKFEKHYPKEIKASLQKAIQVSIKDLVEVIFALEVELRELSGQVKAEPLACQPKSRFWRKYEA